MKRRLASVSILLALGAAACGDNPVGDLDQDAGGPAGAAGSGANAGGTGGGCHTNCGTGGGAGAGASAGAGGGTAGTSGASGSGGSEGGVCVPGQDQTCNISPEISAYWGHCLPGGTCQCNAGFVVDPASGKCWPEDAVCVYGQDQTCNDDPHASALWGWCMASGACGCHEGFEINPATGKCRPEETPCGDPTVMAKYESCRATTDQPSCVAAGGMWTEIGLSPEPMCVCPTGQEGCACERSTDCVAGCRAEASGSPHGDCSQVELWTCVPSAPWAGCWCVKDDLGQGSVLCID